MDETQTTVFAGIDPRDDGEIPQWYRTAVDASANRDADFPTFADAYAHLPEAEERAVAYENENGDWAKSGRHTAVVNKDTDWLFDVHGGQYQIVNPDDVLGPLVAVLNQRRDELGDVFGAVRSYRNGGDVHADILFDDKRIADPQSDDTPYVLGLTFGWDFFAGQRLYAEPVVFDTRNSSSMRELADPRKRKHTGDAAGDVAEWWDDALNTLDVVEDTIYGVLVDAREYTVEFNSLPIDVAEFYAELGFPASYIDDAVALLEKRNRGTGRLSALALYQAMTETFAENFGGKPSTLSRHMKKANRVLYAPSTVTHDVLESKEQELREKNQDTLDTESESAADRLRERREDMGDVMDAHATNKERLRVMMTEAESIGAEA